MIDNYVRPLLPGVTQPIIELYKKLGLSPNQVTLLGLAVAIVASLAVAVSWYWLALVLWWLSRLLDGTDGILARETNQKTDFGAYLDIVIDMAAYSAMIAGFYISNPELGLVWIATLLGYVLCITSALSLGSLEKEHSRNKKDNRGLRLGAGLAEAGETGVAYTMFLLFPDYLTILSLVWLTVLAVTIVARTMLARDILVPSASAEQYGS